MKPAPLCTPNKIRQKEGRLFGVTGPSGIEPFVITQDFMSEILKALACIREKISGLSHVKQLAYSPKGQLFSLIIFVDDYKKEVLKPIYNAQMEITRLFPHLMFDFSVIFNPKAEPPTGFISEAW